jgi:predicted peptidase
MIVVSPQRPLRRPWDNEELLAMLDHLEREFNIDVSRVYIAGHSLGGFGTWELITTAPERFAAAIPSSGGGNPEFAGRLIGLPIWAFHGEEDRVVSVERSKTMVDAVNAAGGHAKLTIYPEQGHNICDLTFSDEKIYEWMLQQRRKKTAASMQQAIGSEMSAQ